MNLKSVLVRGKPEEKAIAVGGSGKVNGLEFPMLEYDGFSKSRVLYLGKLMQKLHGLNVFALFKTKNGFHIRYYFDTGLSHETIKKIVSSSFTNKEYSQIAKENYCINRVAGKYEKNDLFFLGLFGEQKKVPLRNFLIGNSLLKLHLGLARITFPKELVLNE